MGAVVGLAFAGGLLLLFGRRPARRRRRGPDRADASRAAGGPGRVLSGWAARRAGMLAAAGLPGVGAGQLLGAQAAAALSAGAIAFVVTGSTSIGVCFGVFGFLGPVALVRRLRANRARELRDAWPDVVDNLASAVRAGLSLPEAVSAIAERGPAPLRPAFARFAADHRATGQFLVCLDRLKDDLSDPVADRICEALRVAREVGGTDLGRLLRTLAGFLREDARIRAELETRQGWTVNAARLAVAGPWLVLVLLATQSTTLTVFDRGSGRLLLAVGGALTVLAYRLMLRIGHLPDERRVLA
ncbi:type II secretion system F family protein [Cryptosporangium sp. NPDC051539]|uniref:type II secretion system F family protein n=1 Tax=Cryptosporangium sp. NPDC051539 TaxID=3363962 RepID=UPI003788BEE4